MVNDLTTLIGSLVEAKDQLIYQLGQKGVTATFDPVTGLEGLIYKISEIPTGTATITLTTNKSILSYYDSETATLTATHSQGAGQSVSVYNAVTGTKIGDMTDNNDGTYTYTYNSAGVGDISMTCATTSLESNSINICDALLYRSGNIVIEGLSIQLPSHFQINVKTIKTATSASVGTLNMWDSSNKAVGFGSFDNSNTSYNLGYYNGSSWSRVKNFTLTQNTEYEWIYVYNKGVSTCEVNGEVLALSQTHSTVKIDVGIASQPNMKFKDLLIVPL